jgi:hypothetical protein
MVDYDRKIVYCDCCGRQIVTQARIDKYVSGPLSQSLLIDLNTHCCKSCLPSYIEWDKIDREQNGF